MFGEFAKEGDVLRRIALSTVNICEFFRVHYRLSFFSQLWLIRSVCGKYLTFVYLALLSLCPVKFLAFLFNTREKNWPPFVCLYLCVTQNIRVGVPGFLSLNPCFSKKLALTPPSVDSARTAALSSLRSLKIPMLSNHWQLTPRYPYIVVEFLIILQILGQQNMLFCGHKNSRRSRNRKASSASDGWAASKLHNGLIFLIVPTLFIQ